MKYLILFSFFFLSNSYSSVGGIANIMEMVEKLKCTEQGYDKDFSLIKVKVVEDLNLDFEFAYVIFLHKLGDYVLLSSRLDKAGNVEELSLGGSDFSLILDKNMSDKIYFVPAHDEFVENSSGNYDEIPVPQRLKHFKTGIEFDIIRKADSFEVTCN